MSTDSRVWLVTGTSSGLGLALVTELLKSSDRVVATARNLSGSNALVALQSQYPTSQLLVLTLDVTDISSIQAAFGDVEKHFHQLDVVVNNAGYGVTGEIEATPDDVARAQMETLFWGPVNITKQALRMFKSVNAPGKGGRVLNISSVGGYSANPTLAFYSAGKFALEAFTEAFTREMPPSWNIKGIIIEPGGFQTNWRDSHTIPCPADYPPSAPSRIFRSMVDTHTPIGDLTKAARAMIRMAGEKDPPMRVQLGTDSFGIVCHQARKTIREAEMWQEVAHGTNLEEVDGSKVLDGLKAALG